MLYSFLIMVQGFRQHLKQVTIRLSISLIFVFSGSLSLLAQQSADTSGLPVLRLDEAIQIGLQQNFGISIAKNEAEIASLNRNLGAAGFFPRLDASVGYSGGREDVVLTENGNEFPSVRTTNNATNMDVALDWTIFDGFKMFTTYNRLKELESLGKIRAQIEIENTIADIITGYYDIVRLGKRLAVLENTVEISEERYRIADTKRQIGTGSEYDLLLAQTDLNSDRAAVIREKVLYNDSRLRLLRFLNLSTDTEFEVDPEIILLSPLELTDIMSGIETRNRQLESANLQYRIAGLQRQEILRDRMPRVGVNAGYNVNNREMENTVRRLQETDGYRYGITLRIPIIDGLNLNRKLQAARIFEKNAGLVLDEQNMILRSIASAEFTNYISTREIVAIEQENILLANQTLEIALERFYLGTITSLELRESQRTLINTETRLIAAQYEAKASETELLRLMGRLLED
jgi:outer membrane protein